MEKFIELSNNYNSERKILVNLNLVAYIRVSDDGTHIQYLDSEMYDTVEESYDEVKKLIAES